MKVRTCAWACSLMLTAPLIAGVAPGWLPDALAPSAAHAQDKVTELAREKFKEGVKAYDSGQFEQARTLFLQAYALKRHPAVLLNLGQSEMKAGYIEDGGNHLQQFLREHGEATPEQKAAANAGIQEAQRKTGFVIVIVDADDADVGIDGQSIGQSPLLDPYFVRPGKHTVSAAKAGKTGSTEVEVKRGVATPVTVNTGAPSSVVAPVPAPVPTPTPSPAPIAAPAPLPEPQAYPPPPGPGGPPMGPGYTIPPDSGGDSGERQAFFPWFADTPLAWVGAGITGAGLIGTIAFGIAAADASASAEDVTTAIQAEQARFANDPAAPGHVPSTRQPCGPEDDPSGDIAYYREACNQLRDNIDAYDADLIGVAVFATVGGLALAGTIVYYFIDSPGKGSASLQIAPIVGSDTQGMALTGRF